MQGLLKRGDLFAGAGRWSGLSVAAAALLLAGSGARGDTLALRGGTTFQGVFTRFKQDKFYFQPEGGKEIIELRVKVFELKLDPPANVVVKPNGKKKRDDLKLIGYEESTFRFSGGVTMASPTVSSIQMGLDFNRPVSSAGSATVSGSTDNLDIASLVEMGVVTVIHFDLPSVVASVRQGNYIAALAGDSKGKIKVVKVPLGSFDTALAKKYGITSAPQFWFYNSAGKLVTKLTERFTEEDIGQALKEAMR
jgi:hypothetical protein